MPLVFQAFNWIHGVYVGATMGSEMTAAAAGAWARSGATRWRCCPSAATTWAITSRHWLICASCSRVPPKIFHVNWFRRGADGKFLWPGYGENMRVLKWIVDRCRGRVPANETPLGWMPDPKDIDTVGLAELPASGHGRGAFSEHRGLETGGPFAGRAFPEDVCGLAQGNAFPA